jgi:hypothetical protein
MRVSFNNPSVAPGLAYASDFNFIN